MHRCSQLCLLKVLIHDKIDLKFKINNALSYNTTPGVMHGFYCFPVGFPGSSQPKCSAQLIVQHSLQSKPEVAIPSIEERSSVSRMDLRRWTTCRCVWGEGRNTEVERRIFILFVEAIIRHKAS